MPLCRRTTIASSRRGFLEKAGLGFGALAAGCLLQGDAIAANSAAKGPDFPAKAKSVIFLFMDGGPSHIDTFDPKPLLATLDGKTVLRARSTGTDPEAVGAEAARILLDEHGGRDLLN